ncbi:carboxypeptidase regulatory-like domain-containing protein [Haloarcula salina]|uniref:Carboxypeptidase regulatory-like domain-containing protein n=1 Tax=Haloarcula salina TaxID=1429914 RepID=A0AA41KHT2_9EURY|nr:carboxypeptidase regulatory-like domain-containing protein [Haloarcula salina]MBV0902111.1 carboxypeptidase regulatory-like domain-containing protein [Haloarcula salina]
MAAYRDAFVVCLVALLVGTTASGTVAAQSQVTLTVTVVDQDGDTISDVDISARWDDGAGGPVNETTRANGQALVDVPAGANVTIQIHDDRYVRNVPVEVVDAETQAVEVDVSESATATVRAVNADGDPVENPRIRLYRDGNYVVDRNAGGDGSVTTKPVEEGEYRVIVTKPGFYRNLTSVDVSGETSATIQLREGAVLLRASVADDYFDDPRPIRDATVSISSDNGFSGTVPTLSDGTASVSVPVNDRYDVTVTKDGYETVDRTVRVDESETAIDVAIQRTPALTLTPTNRRVVVGETVRLTVVDEYGEPVANATVSQGGSEVGLTDAEGELSATVPSAGNVTFTATADDLSATANVTGVSADGDGGAATPAPTQEQTPTGTTDAGGPGFTAGLAALALLAAALLARHL